MWIFNTREGSVRTLMVEQEKERRVMFCPITEAWGGWTRGAVIGPQTPVVDIVSREGEVGDSREWSRSWEGGEATRERSLVIYIYIYVAVYVVRCRRFAPALSHLWRWRGLALGGLPSWTRGH